MRKPVVKFSRKKLHRNPIHPHLNAMTTLRNFSCLPTGGFAAPVAGMGGVQAANRHSGAPPGVPAA